MSSNNGIVFDLDNDSHKTGTGWVTPDDGLLVFDRNDNGKINNDSELFGDQTVKKDGSLAKDGFDALKDLDTNGEDEIELTEETKNLPNMLGCGCIRDLAEVLAGYAQLATHQQ